MRNMMKWMLAAAMVVGGLGLSATPAKAAQISFAIGSGPAYASPGPGYAWVNGFWANGYWVPGRWAFVGGYNGYANGYYYGDHDDYYRDRDDYYRGDDYRDRGDYYRDRGDRYRDRGWGRDGGRGDGWRGERGRDH